MLNGPEETLASIKGKLGHYRRDAPHYDEVVRLVERTFSERSDDSLVALNVSSLRTVSEYLAINFDYNICSDMGLTFPRVEHPGQWALRIAEQLGAKEYVNPLGGAHLFRPEEFDAIGVRLGFVDLPAMSYDPKPYQFVPSLSCSRRSDVEPPEGCPKIHRRAVVNCCCKGCPPCLTTSLSRICRSGTTRSTQRHSHVMTSGARGDAPSWEDASAKRK